MADPEGVPWVPWNPSFEGLPSKILCANILCTLCSHMELRTSASTVAIMHVSTPVTRIQGAQWPTCTYILPEA